MTRSRTETLCWECVNGYADRCKKFSTDKPLLDMWSSYETYIIKIPTTKKELREVTAYVVLSCRKFIPEKRVHRDKKFRI